METWYFTFGCGQPLGGNCQPILAPSYSAARAMMCSIYGDKWAFQYSQEQWESNRDNPDRYWPMEHELPVVTYNLPEEVEE